ncbi:uracil-DNA glycosylase family protein [uncultured Arthrobacter sp.]|uniref:uracil-DNA glycosylase family protein n=1 Tax=uncultured Arthrobacter sp. TaxID=114050 RepID=UPI00260ADFF6|nr:uracil-DNA glycosylase family protein [uncultured Arthrobacter sp.]
MRAIMIREVRELRGHQSLETWMGKEYLTLGDLWPESPKAVVVGINPAPVSVGVGHYHQGTLGIRLSKRLTAAGVLPPNSAGFMDDVAMCEGLGFTDLVKRPTSRAAEIGASEMTFGCDRLEREIAAREVPLVIFVFKAAATQLLGKFPGNGLLEDHSVGGAAVFIMPGPYEAAASSNKTLVVLRELWLKND